MSKNDNPLLTSRAREAIMLAFDLHQGQVRKSRGGQIPYFSHLSTVAGMVLELGADEDIYIAAILHDSVEDQADKLLELWLKAQPDRSLLMPIAPDVKQNCALAYIREKFGDRPADIIYALTDPKLPREFKKLPRDQRAPFIKEQRVKKFEKLRAAETAVRIVKSCDALHNLRSLYQDYTETGPDVFKNFVADQEGTIWYYEELMKLFSEYGPRRAGVEMSIMLTRLKNLIRADQGVML